MSTSTTSGSHTGRRLASISMPSPVGRLEIVAHDTALVAIRWDTDDADAHHPDRLGEVEEVAPGDHPVLDRAVVELSEYFEGTRTEFDLPVDPAGTPFQRAAWAALTQIPFGETVSYGQQARMLGDVNKSRAVGAANGRNPIPIVVPCHRVVGHDGRLTGFAGGLAAKAWLLDHELAVRAGAG